jgi:predicted NAD/FAD-dependent oxidoreductase
MNVFWNVAKGQLPRGVVPGYSNVAVIGGGITGAVVASILAERSFLVHLFDQGETGFGGRASLHTKESIMKWDMGCQFFRADTERFKRLVRKWEKEKLCREWTGNFASNSSSNNTDFFGFPFQPPFYCGNGGMQAMIEKMLVETEVFKGTKVTQIEWKEEYKNWILSGYYGGDDDSKKKKWLKDEEQKSEIADKPAKVGSDYGYEIIVFTDINSVLGISQPAVTGIPEEFVAQVRQRVGSRVPLFAATITLASQLPVSLDAASFVHDDLWFAARMNSKPGFAAIRRECWTLVSTPTYAMQQIQLKAKDDPNAEAILQADSEYLKYGPATDLDRAFRQVLLSGCFGPCSEEDLPITLYRNAKLWTNAMPSGRHDDESLQYNFPMPGLAPTRKVREGDNFVLNKDHQLILAGDMVSIYSPGVEAAALSALDTVEKCADLVWDEEVNYDGLDELAAELEREDNAEEEEQKMRHRAMNIKPNLTPEQMESFERMRKMMEDSLGKDDGP